MLVGSYQVFIPILQGCFIGPTGVITWLSWNWWNNWQGNIIWYQITTKKTTKGTMCAQFLWNSVIFHGRKLPIMLWGAHILFHSHTLGKSLIDMQEWSLEISTGQLACWVARNKYTVGQHKRTASNGTGNWICSYPVYITEASDTCVYKWRDKILENWKI